MRIFQPGDKVDNYTMDWPYPVRGLKMTVHERSILVGEPTPLSDLLAPNMGTRVWAACTIYDH